MAENKSIYSIGYRLNRFQFAGKLIQSTVLVLAVLIAFSAKAEQAQPRQVIERFHESLIAVMKEGENLGYQGRYAWLEPIIKETFYLSEMTRISTGRNWDKASPAIQADVIDAFNNMTIANYSSRFDAYDGEVFETMGVEDAPRETAQVKTQIIQSNGEPVSFNYLLRKNDQGEWRVVDIFLKGTYSELATRKSEYVSVIRNKGFDALINALREKTVNIAKKAEDS